MDFIAQMIRRHTTSMRERIDINEIWRSTRERLLIPADEPQRSNLLRLPVTSPYAVDEITSGLNLDATLLAERLRALMTVPPGEAG